MTIRTLVGSAKKEKASTLAAENLERVLTTRISPPLKITIITVMKTWTNPQTLVKPTTTQLILEAMTDKKLRITTTTTICFLRVLLWTMLPFTRQPNWTQVLFSLTAAVTGTRRHDLMPEHQKVQNRSQRIQSIQIKKEICKKKKESAAAQQEMRHLREEIDRNEERFRQLSDKVEKNKMLDAGMAAELQGCMQKKKEAAMLRKQVMAAWRPCGSNLSPWERMELRPLYKGSKGMWERHKGRCQEEKKKEEAVKKYKSKTRPVSNWRCRGQAGVMKALQRVVWSLIFLVFGVDMVKAEEQGNQAQISGEKNLYPIPRVDVRWKRMRSY